MRAAPHGPNGHSSATGWAGLWGPLSDGRSRLARRAKRLARAELDKLGIGAPTPLQWAQAREVGDFLAIRDMVKAGIGLDPSCTIRRLTAVAKSAEAERRGLRVLVARDYAGDDLARRLARVASR
jgi:hypothetical protein